MSRKWTKSRTRARKLHLTEAKARVGRARKTRADLERQLKACKREIANARERLIEATKQQTATSEMLRIISDSPLQSVLDAVAEHAARLCNSNHAEIYRLENNLLRLVAAYGDFPMHSQAREGFPVNRDRVIGRTICDRRSVHVHDLAAEDSEYPSGSSDAKRLGHRTTLGTPLLRERTPIGGILFRRFEVRPFSDNQIALLKSFADQAAIAIENVRLFEAEKQRTLALAQANRDLAEREARIWRLVDANIIGIVIWTIDGRFIEANDAFLRMVGYDREDLISDRVHRTDLTPPEWRDRDVQTVAELKMTGTAQPYEKEYFRKDGSRVPVLIGAAAFDEKRDQGVGFVIDLTERKRADAALGESEQRFRDYAEIASDWLWETGPDHCFTKFSLQHPFSDYLGKTRWDLAADREEEPEKWREHRAILEARQPFRGFRFRSLSDGTELHVSVSGKPVFDVKGEFLGYRGVTTDLTAEERAVEALRASEEQWKAVFENNPVMYFMVGATGTILSVNPFGAEQLGYSVDELVGRPVHFVFHENDRETVQTFAATCFERPGHAMSWELRKVRKNGEVIWVRETARATVINKRSVLLIVCEDITEGKRAIEALREMQTELAHANRVTTMGQLTASIAHEVNQPIAAAHNNAGAALNFLDARPPDLEEVREALHCIVNDTDRAGDVIDRIRALIRKAPARAEIFDMNEAIRDVIIVTRAEAMKNGISLEEQLTADLPLINGDRIQLQQVILNLIINAIEAMSGVDERARQLLIKTAKFGSDAVSVSVQDSGPGLDPGNLNRAFDAFYTTKPGGLGMGLSICRSIVEAHGGRLAVAANVPHGTIFQFSVPVRGGAS